MSKEKIQQAIKLLEEVLQESENTSPPITDLSIKWERENAFLLEWNSNNERVLFDIYFKDTTKHRDWLILSDYTDTYIDGSTERHLVGFGDNDTDQHPWEAKLVEVKQDGKYQSGYEEGFETKTVSISPNVKEENPPETICKFFGFWDSRLVPDEFPVNVSKGYLGQLSSLEGDLIPIISGFSKDDPKSKIRSRFEGRKDIIDSYSDRIKLIILQDEPFYKGFKTEKLEQIVEIGKEVLGDRYKLGYTFADANTDLDLPTNIDFAGFNLYLLFEEDYDYQFIDTEDKFINEMNRLLNQAKESIGDTDILVVAQTFSHKGKYRDPDDESPLWYARYTVNHPNIVGMLNYRWRYEKGKGAEDLSSKFKENLKKAYSIACSR